MEDAVGRRGNAGRFAIQRNRTPPFFILPAAPLTPPDAGTVTEDELAAGRVPNLHVQNIQEQKCTLTKVD